MSLKINILIVDDEKKACTNLKNILNEYIDPDIHVAGIAHDTKEAEEQIRLLAPDAVFLDIEMPNENAFHFLDRIAPVPFEVVFVTAYDDYAVKAFKLNAVDYILKPISIPELRNAVNKLREKVRYKKFFLETNTSYTEISNQLKTKAKHQKITLRDHNNTEVIDFADIYFVEAQSSYSKIVFARDNGIKEIIMSSPLSDYEELLPADLFYRIHRSFLVNCRHVTKIVNGNINQVTVKGKYILPVSRRRYAPLLEFLTNNEYHV